MGNEETGEINWDEVLGDLSESEEGEGEGEEGKGEGEEGEEGEGEKGEDGEVKGEGEGGEKKPKGKESKGAELGSLKDISQASVNNFLKSDEGKRLTHSQTTLDQIQNDITQNASIKDLLTQVKGVKDEKLFGNLIHTTMQDVRELDSDVYGQIAANIGAEIAQALYQEGQRTGVKEMQEAAKHLHKFVSGSTRDVSGDVKDQRVSAMEASETKRSKDARDDAWNQLHDAIFGDLNTQLDSKLPKGIPDFARDAAKTKIFQDLNTALGKDFLITGAIQNFLASGDFTLTKMGTMKQTVLNKVVELLPGILKGIRKDLRGMITSKPGNTEGQEGNEEEEGGEPKTIDLSKKAGKRIDYSKTSDQDILNNKITYAA